MRILKLQAENIKKIKVISIKPDGSLIQLSGGNGEGKTSVLDCISMAFGGDWQVPAQPLRRGAKEGFILAEVGEGQQVELKVTREFLPGRKPTLTVESVAGARFTDPTTMLKALLGKLSFDPLEFSRMPLGESKNKPGQITMLREAVGLAEIDDLITAYKRDYEARTPLKKEITGLENREAAIEVPDGTPDKQLDVSTMIDKLQRAGEHNTSVETLKMSRSRMADHLETRRAEVVGIVAEVKRLRQAADGLEREAADKQRAIQSDANDLAKASPLPALIDTAALGAEIEAARKTNEHVSAKARRLELTHELMGKNSQLAALDAALDANKAKQAQLIRDAKMPLAGLVLTEKTIEFNGLPLEQASGAEKLRVSVAVAMAMNPKLRVLRIQDGSLLDSSSLKMIADMAEAADYQIWMEVVDTTGKVGIVMEDGEIVAVNPSTKTNDTKTPRKRKVKNDEA